MIAPLYDASGKQLNFGYDGATIANRHNAFKPVSSPLISEDEVLPIHKRQVLIAHLHDLYRNDALTQSIVHCITSNVGYPKMRSKTDDEAFNDDKEALITMISKLKKQQVPKKR